MNGISIVTLIIVIIWTFFWIGVGALGNSFDENSLSFSGIIVYIFFGLPTTLVGWFLWWWLHPEDKRRYTTTQLAGWKSEKEKRRQGLLQAQSQSSKPPKAKKKKNVMHYLRCGGDCGLEEFLKNEADGHQYCKNCGWIKR